MALFVSVCFFVLLNFEMILLLEAKSGFGIEISNGVKDANLVPLAKYSFVVLVNLTIKQTYCTGALISRRFVLTVAHCVEKELDTSVRVYKGSIDDEYIEYVYKTSTNTTEEVKRTGYEERQSVAIFKPWLYKTSGSMFDIALIKVEKMFADHNFVKTTIRTPFIQYDALVTCTAIGFNVDAIPPYRFSNTSILTEQTILVAKQCEEEHKPYDTCSGMPWIVQQDTQYINNNFIDSGALLLCSDDTTLEPNFNGIAIGKVGKGSLGPSKIAEYPTAFTDICPYLSWIRSHVGPSIIRSPGHYGKDCFYSGSSIKTRAKSRMAWFVVVVCILLYL